MLRVELSNHAKSFLKKCDKQLYERLVTKLNALALDPFPSDVKRVLGRKEKVFRIRVGDYRIQFVVFYENNILFITDIDKRPRVY